MEVHDLTRTFPFRNRGWLVVAIIAMGALVLFGSAKRHAVDHDLAILRTAVEGAQSHIVGLGVVKEYVQVTGALAPAAIRVFQAPWPGKITAIYVEEGVEAASGKPLYDIEPSTTGFGQAPSTEKVRSTMAGKVASVDSSAHSFVLAGQPIVTIIDDSKFTVPVEVDEVDLTRVDVDMPASVTFDAIAGLELAGRVASIGAMATARGGIVTIPARITLDSADSRLRAGITANARITVSLHSGVLRIPSRAWIDWKGSPSAIVLEGGELRIAVLEIGVSDGDYVQVLSGLSEGDTIVEDAVAAQAKFNKLTGADQGVIFRMRPRED